METQAHWQNKGQTMSKTNILEEIEEQKVICLLDKTVTTETILNLLEIIKIQQQKINDLEIKIFEIEDKTRIKW